MPTPDHLGWGGMASRMLYLVYLAARANSLNGVCSHSEIIHICSQIETAHSHRGESIHFTSRYSDETPATSTTNSSNGVVNHTIWWDGWGDGEVK